jgi:riboflavin biosynthesis pyrimidine reductase
MRHAYGQPAATVEELAAIARAWRPFRSWVSVYFRSSEAWPPSDKLQVFDRSQKTLCYNILKHEEHPNLSLVRVEEENFISNLVNDLTKQKIQSVIIEGGATTLQLFMDLGLWDEARVFVGDKSFGNGIRAPQLHGNLIGQETVFNDTLRIYQPINGKNQHR